MEFSELRNIDLRRAWPNEAQDFTPWLSDNLERLSEAIGMALELEGTEVSVDQFSADILARCPESDSRVLIENQLEWTDHTHLGQILTYLAGLEAETIIWIARDFVEAHLSAIRWLNEHTADPFAFFAVKVSVVRIGDDESSPVAPLFEVLERPIGWDRKIRSQSQKPSEKIEKLRQFRRGFWRTYVDKYPDDVQLREDHKDSNVYHQIGGVTVAQYLAQNAVGVYIQQPSTNSDQNYRDRYEECVSAMENEQDGIGRLHTLKVDSNDKRNWPKMIDWLHSTLVRFRDVLSHSDQ